MPADIIAQDRIYKNMQKRSIKLQPMDTTNAVVFETPTALVYFSRADVIERTLELSKEIGFELSDQLNLLHDKSEKIHIHRDSIYDPIGEGLHRRRSGKDNRDNMAWVIELIASDLLIEGKALPVRSSTGMTAKRRIRCATERNGEEEGLWLPPGNRSLVFRFRNGVEIHRIVTAFGE